MKLLKGHYTSFYTAIYVSKQIHIYIDILVSKQFPKGTSVLIRTEKKNIESEEPNRTQFKKVIANPNRN